MCNLLSEGVPRHVCMESVLGYPYSHPAPPMPPPTHSLITPCSLPASGRYNRVESGWAESTTENHASFSSFLWFVCTRSLLSFRLQCDHQLLRIINSYP